MEDIFNAEHQDIEHHYLKLLAGKYPNAARAMEALVYLQAGLELPKETELFISDVHGEYEAFRHLLKNGSGAIKRRIDEIFAESLSPSERRSLCTLIYYPERKLPLLLDRFGESMAEKQRWLRQTLLHLIKACRTIGAKYPRRRVVRLIRGGAANLIEELLYVRDEHEDKKEYYARLVEAVAANDTDGQVITGLAHLIQDLSIGRLHVIGDIYDRGPGAHLIMDHLMTLPDVDIQWGNHDILWMGAALGSEACIANVVRICLRYGNMETLENGYGISLLPLVGFVLEHYGDDPAEAFTPKIAAHARPGPEELALYARMHKAITILQFKAEAEVIQRRPEYRMQERILLDRLRQGARQMAMGDAVYELTDSAFPTLDPDDPLRLTDRENDILAKLKTAFTQSRALKKHVDFLLAKGGLYRIHNGNLLFHGCIPMRPDGEFEVFKPAGEALSGKAYLDYLDRAARSAAEKAAGTGNSAAADIFWYLWCGPKSPLMGKDKMATFERYWIKDANTHKERPNPYFALRESEPHMKKILTAFGLDPETGCIINGHVPVQVNKGEKPVKAGGRLLAIDGGLSKAYQGKTGIAGYTLIHNSHGFLLAQHYPFDSVKKAIEEERDIDSQTEIITRTQGRIRLKHTDWGKSAERRIDELKRLIRKFREGALPQSLWP